MQDTDQWQEQFATRLKQLESNQVNVRDDVNVLQDWRINHMSECHPKILAWQSLMWGNWLKVTGIAIGAALALGFMLGQLYPILERWLGK